MCEGITAKNQRSTPQRDPEAGPKAYKKVRYEVSRSELRATQIIDLPRTPKREARKGKLACVPVSVDPRLVSMTTPENIGARSVAAQR